MGAQLLKHLDLDAVDMSVKTEQDETTKTFHPIRKVIIERQLEETCNSALNGLEETTEYRPTQQKTWVTGDNPKGQQVHFQSEK